MVANRLPKRMTVEEWRALERASPDARHEYIDGYVYAIAGGTQANNRIALNAIGVLDRALGDGPCIAYALDLAARLSESRFTYPDVLVSCQNGLATREQTEIEAPRVAFEVLSESTERYDRGLKFAYYRECPSLEEYVLVGTEYQMVEVYHRMPEGWGLFRAYGSAGEVELLSIDVRFPVAALYRRTDVPTTPAP